MPHQSRKLSPMCNFNKLSEQTKADLHLLVQNAAQSVGGVNYLLSLIEAIRSKKPHPLAEKNSQIASNNTIIKWNKVIFKDKVDLLESLIHQERDSQDLQINLMNYESPKKRKNISNMIKTLSPLEFTLTPQNPKDGNGLSLKLFENMSEEGAKLNPLFLALFFCSVEFSKQALKHDA